MFRTGSIVILVLATCLALLAAPASADPPAQQSPTGFAISNAKFQDYFDHRGGARNLGYPISREFSLLGNKVQFFQRAILQVNPDGGVGLMNILDEGLLPYTHINNSTFPAPDPAVMAAAPSASDPNYASLATYFVRAYAPDEWDGMKVNFSTTFNSTVSYQDAFPKNEGDEALLPLINLEMWGLPISKPAYDPNNKNFVYLRFQRGIMHFDKTTGLTQGILIGDYLKSVITGQNLPVDLANDARSSRLYLQYNNAVAGGVNRPADLPGTSLFAAFEKDGVAVAEPQISLAPTATAVPPTPVPAQPTAVPAATQVPAPSGPVLVPLSQWWLEQTNMALDVLNTKSPYYASLVKSNVARIEQTLGPSSLDVATKTLRINEETAFPPKWRIDRETQIEWYVGLIIHNATHLKQAAEGRPYTGYEAEQEARRNQRDEVAQIETTKNPGGQFYNFLTDVIEGREAIFGCWDAPKDPVTATATPTP